MFLKRWKKGGNCFARSRLFSPFSLIVLLIIVHSFIPFISAQVNTAVPRENPEVVIERIRLYYGLKQYQQVVLECYRLEAIDPGNKMANYYKTRAQSRLTELGLPIPTPAALTPVPTPETTPFTPVPTLVTPVQTQPPAPTQAPELPAFPGMASPAQSPTPRATSPFFPGVTLEETPVTEAPIPAETTPAPVMTREEPETTPVAPAPPQDVEPGAIDKFMNYQESNPLLFFGILAALLLFAVLIVLAIVLFLRKATMKKRISKLQQLTEKAQEKMAETIPMKQEAGAEKPPAPPETPGFDFQIPDLPTPEAFGADMEAPPPMPFDSQDFQQPTLPEIAEPADIPSPSTADQIIPIPDSEPGLPDIPSPTAPPVLKQKPEGDQDLAGLPPDLPTFGAAPEPSPIPATSYDELELPAFSLDEEKPVFASEAQGTPPTEEPPSFDLPASQEAIPPTSSPFDDIFLETPPSETEKKHASDKKQEPLFSFAPSVSGEEQAPSISIEDALGLSGSPPPSSDDILIPSQEITPAPQGDPGATSMDIDAFLFDVSSEDNAETALDIPGKEKQSPSPISEPPALELESDSGIEREKRGKIIFDEKALAETKIKAPEAKQRPLSSQDLGSTRKISFPTAKDVPQEKKEDQSPFFTPYLEMKQEKPAFQSVSSSTTKRMDNILPFDQKERETHGLHRTQKQDRNEALFQEQFQKGIKAFDEEDWKKAVYYLTVASAIKPDNQELKDKLSIAREKKRIAK
ncbi:hypothetical protein JW926_08550 [Candidatus Sumerlaeota bacterium]|nr:hypothetical protein [Candidatus Sumerlaeota bacterium]